MLDPTHGSMEPSQQPGAHQEASSAAPESAQQPATPKIESHHEAFRNTVIGVASNGNDRIDQTAYRESYHSENGKAVAHYESGSIVAPPPEDPPTEAEGKEGDDYTQEIQPMTLPIQKLSSTPAYHAAPSVGTTTTTPPTAEVYKHAPQEYAAVLKEPLEDRQRDKFFTYIDQVCTGVVLLQTRETSVADAAAKCSEMECHAANIHGVSEGSEDEFEVVYLKTADSRKDNKGFYCISSKSRFRQRANEAEINPLFFFSYQHSNVWQ